MNPPTPTRRREEAEKDLESKRALAHQYQLMMELSAWKHFEGIMKRIGEQATATEDNIPIYDLDKSVGLVGECRGRRAVIKKLQDELAFILHGFE